MEVEWARMFGVQVCGDITQTSTGGTDTETWNLHRSDYQQSGLFDLNHDLNHCKEFQTIMHFDF